MEDGVAGERGEPCFGLGPGRSGQRLPIGVRTHLCEQLAAGERLFGLDLVAEPGTAGA
ncbi:hypothetical protein [Streptomyces sp. TP-A0356]|uniref:hypothetical protein n=1 Tax=Streptomyces sp. TP-A0356 TaxID=1359208 RepID=UPI00131A6711|nr:hypothetical protein [Streptomyces sp. TP-A0356]